MARGEKVIEIPDGLIDVLTMNAVTKALGGRSVDFQKLDVAERIVGGVVYPASTSDNPQTDSEGDWCTQDDLALARMKYIGQHRENIKRQHQARTDAKWVASYQLAKDFQTADGYVIEKGDWVGEMFVGDEDAWAAIKAGEITGFSMGGTALVAEEDD